MTSTTLPCTWIGSPNRYRGRQGRRITHITLHVMAGYLNGTDSTFQRPGGASAHYGIGRDGTIHQYVDEDDGSWSDANRSSNLSTVSIEHEGGIPGAAMTAACIEASARLCADIAGRQGWTRLRHDGLDGNVWLHREIPGTDHADCPDLAPNGLPYRQVIEQANRLLGAAPAPEEQGEDDMATTVNIHGQIYDAGYALEYLINSIDALGGATNIANQVLYASDTGRIEDTPRYELRAVKNTLDALAQKNGIGTSEIQAAVAQGVRQAIESIRTTVEVKP